MDKVVAACDATPSERPAGRQWHSSGDADGFTVASARVLTRLARMNRRLAAACEATARAHRHLAECGDASRECRERAAWRATQDRDLAAALRDTADAYDAN